LVAELDGTCVGWGHGYFTLTPDTSKIGYVDAIYVGRQARRRGVGSALLAAVTEWLEAQGVDRIELLTPARADARALWVKRGFRPFLETLVYEPTKR
jgi:GNAT superfamily N-acetyltransferase